MARLAVSAITASARATLGLQRKGYRELARIFALSLKLCALPNRPAEVLDLFGITPAGRPSEGLAGKVGFQAARFAVDEVTFLCVVFLAGGDLRRFVFPILGTREQDHLFFLVKNQRAFGSQHRFSVAAKSVAVDARIADNNFLFRSFFGIVIGCRIFELTVDMIIDVPIVWKNMSPTDAGDAQRPGLLTVIAEGGNKDPSGIKLVGSEFCHQPATGPVPETPADQFFDCRYLSATHGAVAIPVIFDAGTAISAS